MMKRSVYRDEEVDVYKNDESLHSAFTASEDKVINQVT
jgi:hypothetical protein